MPGAETVKLQVELIEKNAEARLRNLDKLAKEMANRKITLNFDESSLARWKTATEGMTNAQLSAYAKLAVGAENAAAKVVAADLKANQKRVSDEQKTNAKILADRQKSFDKKVELYEKEDTKRRQSAEKTAQMEINARAKVEVATIKGATGVRKLKTETDALNTSSKQTDSIWSSITTRFTAANLISTAITVAISRLRSALREAVSEMKEMDKQLTTIKMVSGASDYDISKLTEQAFAGARANGRSVGDYLTAAERFTRAGYRDNIDQLSKLSLMTQNIGGVEEDVAAKFLLAADAAWKLNGSYDALMGVLDGVSAVADQNATDLGKIAEGITVAGSAFANAGESAQTFTAMLGVTTASTQRSGSEMARGLRTILFRVRQVKAELDDGEVISADDISNAAKALDKVGISVMDDTGKLKSMSEILGELNEKWKTWDNKDWRKSYLQNYLAGNRNGNVLYALMDNWGAYEKMLQQYEESAGTAEQKNEEYLKSWAAAADNLKTSWTELVSTLTNDGQLFTDTIKFADLFVQGTNHLIENSANTKAAESLISAWGQFTKGWGDLRYKDKLFPESVDVQDYADLVLKFLFSFGEAEEESGKAADEATAKLVDYSDAAEGTGKSADDASDGVNNLTNAFEAQRNKISEVAKAIKEEKNDAVNSLADIYKAAMEAADKGYYGSNAYRQGGALFFSEANLDALRKEGKISAREYLDAYFKEAESGDYATAAANFFGKITGGSNEVKAKNGEVLASVKDVGDAYQWTFDKGNRTMEEYLQSLEQQTGIGQAFWAAMMESLGMYSSELAQWEENNGEVKTEAQFEDEQAKKAVDDWIIYLNRVPKVRQTEIRTVYSTYGKEGADNYLKTGDLPGIRHNDVAWEGREVRVNAGGKRDNYSGIALVNDEYPANGSKPELIISKSRGVAYIANGGKPALVNLASDDVVLTASETKGALGIPGFPDGKNGTGAISVTIAKGSGAKASASSGGASITDSSETWNQLKKLIDYMVEEQKGVLDQKLKVLDKQLEELEATRKAQKTEDELSEKQLAVDEALLNLQKAQNERTVRYYNESTHQWEWMADQGVLAEAEEAYSNALKELKDFLSELDFNEQKAAIQAQKDALNEAFDAYKEGWDLIVKSIEKPTGDLAALFAELKVNGTDAMKAQAGNIQVLLGALEEGFFSGIDDISGTATSNVEGVATVAVYGMAEVTSAATSGIESVVRKANEFLESVKKTETPSTADKPTTSSGSGGGGGDGDGTGSTGGASSPSIEILDRKTGNVIGKVQSDISGSDILSTAATFRKQQTMADTGVIKANYSTSSSVVNNNGNNTYINGVKIGNDYLGKPLAQVLGALSIHSNYAN